MITPSKEFWKIFKETSGALSTAEALAIINLAAQAPQGGYLEVGTHKGKSAMSAFYSLKDGDFALVDPIFEDDKISGGVFDAVNVAANNYSLHSPKTVSIVVGTSLQMIPLCNELSYVFVDTGSHGDGLPMKEVKLLEDRIVQGGIIAFHDYKNQFTEVEGAYDYLVSTGKYEPIGINWQDIFDYVKEHNLEEGNNSWHLYPELPHPPNFVGALRRK